MHECMYITSSQKPCKSIPKNRKPDISICLFCPPTRKPSVKRTKEEAEQTRQALLDAAMTVFHQRGVARASLDQIACAAGLTRGALYWHFKNKEHLFEALCERHLAVMHEEMHHMLENDSPQAWDTLVQTHIGFLQRLAEDETFRQFFAILHLKCEETSDMEGITVILRNYRYLWHRQTIQALRMGQRHGRLPATLQVEKACVLQISAFLGLVTAWLSEPDSFDMRSMAHDMVHASIDMLHSPVLQSA